MNKKLVFKGWVRYFLLMIQTACLIFAVSIDDGTLLGIILWCAICAGIFTLIEAILMKYSYGGLFTAICNEDTDENKASMHLN